MKHLVHVAALAAGLLGGAAVAVGDEDHAAGEIRKYREMLEDGNPAELMEMKG